jgi:ATP-dependent protease ClpP protease subunit
VPEASVTYDDPNLIHITGGFIDKHTLEEFTNLSGHIKDWGMVVIDSPGGDVASALAIGRIIRDRSFLTDVAQGSSCASACIFVLAAGVDRSAYGKIGLHRPHFNDAFFSDLSPAEAREKYSQLEIKIHDYLHEMGMPDRLYAAMMQVPSDDIKWLSPAQIHEFGLNGIDPSYEEWLRAQYAQHFGPEGYRRHLEGMNLIGDCISRGDKKCWEDVGRRFPEALWDPRER